MLSLSAHADPATSERASPASTADAVAMPMGVCSADATFIAMMIPHHEGAIAMADLALQRSQRALIRALAKRIRTSQAEENAQMRRWYRQWYGVDVPIWKRPYRGWGMARGVPGFGTSLEALGNAADFDRAFLEDMIAHHRMGVMMAIHAQRGSVHPELRDLEAAMVRIQSEEIDQMERWTRQWFAPASRSGSGPGMRPARQR